MLKEGDKIPLNIKIHNSANEEVTFKDYLGKTLVIYFYPKDQTPGCTVEACNFRDMNKDIEALGAKVVGISSDNQKSHSKFIAKEKLTFELLSDESHELQLAFGVWAEKSMYGRKYMGTLRSTFVIDKTGKILKVWEKVTPLNHAVKVLEYVKTL